MVFRMLRFCCGLLIFVVISVTAYSNDPGQYDDLNELFYDTDDTDPDSMNEPELNPLDLRDPLLGDCKNSFIISSTPECARGRTYCEKFPGYPYRCIKAKLRTQRLPNKKRVSYFFNATKRHDDFICFGSRNVLSPQVALNTKNEWKIVVNQAEYGQKISTQICRGTYSSCGERSHCRQKYVNITLKSLSYRGKLEMDIFRLPSSCGCAIECKSCVQNTGKLHYRLSENYEDFI